jgi:hypothetical protein
MVIETVDTVTTNAIGLAIRVSSVWLSHAFARSWESARKIAVGAFSGIAKAPTTSAVFTPRACGSDISACVGGTISSTPTN